MINVETDVNQSFRYTRMTPNMFNYLLSMVNMKLQRDSRGGFLSPAHRLLMTLHYLAEGCSMQNVARGFRVGKSTVHYIISETCEVLWDTLSLEFLPSPTLEHWKHISKGFYSRWNMPNCIRTVNGKHVHIQCPEHTGSEYFNYKKSFSILFIAICNAYYRFVAIDVGSAGGLGDGDVCKYNRFGANILGGVDLPRAANLPNSAVQLEHFLVADQAFPLSKHIMRLYPCQRSGQTKNIFNYRLSRARRTIENTFGILVQCWRILRKPIIANVELCKKIVLATVVLHNFIQKTKQDLTDTEKRNCPTGFSENFNKHGIPSFDNACTLRSIGRIGSNNATRHVIETCDKLAEYFVSNKGCVPWQWDYVSRCLVPD